MHRKSALRESNPPRQLGRLAPLPLGQGHIHSGGRRGSRTLKAHRSTAFEAAAIAHWLALPLRAAVTGIEPVSVRLTGACPYQHGPHRNRVGAVGFEPTISCFRSRRNCQAFPYAECKSAQRESNPHIRHGKAVGCRYIMGACLIANSIVKDQRAPGRTRTGVAALRVRGHRRAAVVDWPLDDQCFVVSGTGGIRTLTCLVKSQVCGQ